MDNRQQEAKKRTNKALFYSVIGNPPYISYYDMEEKDRQELKIFESCQFGKFSPLINFASKFRFVE